MKVYLYVAIPTGAEARPVHHSALGLVRNRLVRLYDYSAWEILGRFRFTHDTYTDLEDTNIGDIAIRLAVRQEIQGAFAPEIVELEEIRWGQFDAAAAERVNRDGSLLVIGGSGVLHHDLEGHLFPTFLADGPHLAAVQCPMVALALGANRKLVRGGRLEAVPIEPRSRALLADLLARLALISVRDEYSRNVLAAFTTGDVRVVADPALFLAAAGDSPVPPGPRVRIGLNFGFHGPHSADILKRNIFAYLGAIRRLKQRFDPEFFYFVHSQSEDLVVKLLHRAGVRMRVVRGSPSQMLDYYRALTVHVCHMLHSSILALNAGTPAISLAYDVKNLGLFRLLGLEPYVIPHYEVTAQRLVEAVCEQIQNRGTITARLSLRKARLRDELAAFLKEVAALARRCRVEPAGQGDDPRIAFAGRRPPLSL